MNLALTMGTHGITSLLWGTTEMILTPNAAPQLPHAYMTDSAGVRTAVSNIPIATSVVGNTVIQMFPWGMIMTTYAAVGNKLSIWVSVTNTTLSSTIDHLWIYPLGLNLPADPINYDPSFVTGTNIDAPTSIFWTYGSGTLDLTNDDVRNPLACGFWKVSSSTLRKWYVSLIVDSGQMVSKNISPIPRPIGPGITDTYTVAVRFGDSTSTEATLAGDLFARYANTFPRVVKVPSPSRPIGAVCSTSARFKKDANGNYILDANGNKIRDPYPTNPRGWWNDPTVDVTNPAGIAAFQKRFLAFADAAVAEILRVGGMGALLWDLEGQQYDEAYIGDPSQIEAISPEVVGVLDQFVGKFTKAGLRIGFTCRPQAFNLQALTQTNLPEPGKELYRKMQYAQKRWGATLFYIDSNLDLMGTITPAYSFSTIASLMPGTLIFPEWENTKHYAYTIPYNNTLSVFGPPAHATKVYPGALCLLKVNDATAASNPAEITAAIQAGNIALFDGWYRHAANDLIQQIYAGLP